MSFKKEANSHLEFAKQYIRLLIDERNDKQVRDILSVIVNAQNRLSTLQVFNNPVTSFKIDDPKKSSKKERWWIIKLIDSSGMVLKEVLIPFRTKTEVKLYVKSTIGKMYLSRAIDSAVVEGPYKSMMEASKHKTIP